MGVELCSTMAGHLLSHTVYSATLIFRDKIANTIDDWLLGHVGVSEDIRVNVAFLEFLNILHTLSRMFGRN